jgi:hypothetical protein
MYKIKLKHGTHWKIRRWIFLTWSGTPVCRSSFCLRDVRNTSARRVAKHVVCLGISIQTLLLDFERPIGGNRKPREGILSFPKISKTNWRWGGEGNYGGLWQLNPSHRTSQYMTPWKKKGLLSLHGPPHVHRFSKLGTREHRQKFESASIRRDLFLVDFLP